MRFVRRSQANTEHLQLAGRLPKSIHALAAKYPKPAASRPLIELDGCPYPPLAANWPRQLGVRRALLVADRPLTTVELAMGLGAEMNCPKIVYLSDSRPHRPTQIIELFGPTGGPAKHRKSNSCE